MNAAQSAAILSPSNSTHLPLEVKDERAECGGGRHDERAENRVLGHRVRIGAWKEDVPKK